jgi:hypothetical protein
MQDCKNLPRRPGFRGAEQALNINAVVPHGSPAGLSVTAPDRRARA